MSGSKVVKQPTLFLALLPIISMIFFLSFGYIFFELPPEPLPLRCPFIAGALGR